MNSACADPLSPVASNTAVLVDAAGTVHDPAGPDARIVCLVPSITELVCDLGLARQLVGRTGFCIHPWATVRTIPKVGGTKDVKLEKIPALAPTHAIVNIDENLRETAQALSEFVPNVIVTHPQTPRDNVHLYRLLGAIFNRQKEAQALCDEFERAYTAAISGPARPHQEILYLIWREPWMTVSPDTYIAQTLALFNWHTNPTTAADRYPEITLTTVAKTVGRILLSSEPYHFHERDLNEVAAAIPGVQVSLIDGEMTSWYGSRAILGLRYLNDYTRATALSMD